MYATQDRIATSTLRIVDVGQVLDELAELGPEEHEELLRWIWREERKAATQLAGRKPGGDPIVGASPGDTPKERARADVEPGEPRASAA